MTSTGIPEGRGGMFEHAIRFFLMGVVLLTPAAASAQTPAAPEITAQGFDIGEAQTGWLGKFGRLRVRFEAPERIAELRIRERSYEVDLASTLESANLALFGAQSRVRNHKDITLDFENYINRKLDKEGNYQFEITLTDKQGKTATAVLMVIVNREKSSREMMEERLDRIDRGVFSFQRIGTGPVTGASDFGITWKTVEPGYVTIRITNSQGGASKVLRLHEPNFEALDSKSQLALETADAGLAEAIEIPTTRNAAAGETFAVVIQERPYLLRITESRTMLSELGTTVILNGEFKH